MKNKLLLVSMLTLLTVALIAVPAMARQGRGGGHGGGYGQGMGPGMGPCGQGMGMGPGMGLGFGPFWLDDSAVKDLGLSDAQIDKLDALHQAKQQDQIDLDAAMRKAHLAFQNTMRADAVSEAAAKKAADQVVAAQSKLMYAQIEYQLAVRNILTAEQFDKLQDLRPMNRDRRQSQRIGSRSSYPRGR
ncbi:MAG TPA: periplasmic heavy metal sensor [bacterium]|nr:periplasmic heavy metal sensor [bacterium]